MMLNNTYQILEKAQKHGYAVAAFNVENLEMAQAVISAANESRSDVILQISAKTLKYAAPNVFFGMISKLAENSRAQIALHLDHCTDADMAVRVADYFTSVMIDASKYPLEENIEKSKRVVTACRKKGVSVEAELGMVGGKEEDIVCDRNDIYAKAEDCRRFVKETQVDSLAVGIGTMHGIYQGRPKLNIQRLREIRESVAVPLVLHGASGLSKAMIRTCIENGIAKVNFATELRIAFTEAVRSMLAADKEMIDPKLYLGKGMDAVRKIVIEKLKICSMDRTAS